jgi:lysine-ketoglutarate reductase/saccharopine dehydrogenase-like protein (TIGR00300 family)
MTQNWERNADASGPLPRFLLCSPEYYQVDYVINPWMEGNVRRASRERALRQWHKLHAILQKSALIELVESQPGWPDMVFTANAGLVLDNTVVLSRFLHPQRRGEEPHFKRWFEEHEYSVLELPPDLPFEGAGDALLDRAERRLWAAYGFRTELNAHPYLARALEVEVLSLRLVDKRFYHLDTCFCPLPDGYLLYYPPAFDAYSNRLIEMRVAADKRIVVGEVDALHFACNAISIGRELIVNSASDDLKHRLQGIGFSVVETPLGEFLKAGGAAKCLTLCLTEQLAPAEQREVVSRSGVESRTIAFSGHLLDSGLLSRALDAVVDSGGSFQILDFRLGEQRRSTSRAQIKISAPALFLLDTIAAQLVGLGAVLESPDGTTDARREVVTQDGVAPEDFAVTTIYPTQVRVEGQWVQVQEQRMDAVVVVTAGAEKDAPQARCKLLRDLRAGEEVVVGVEGIRLARAPGQRVSENAEAKMTDEFGFMGASISSERRVELVVEQIAWELRRIRDRGGKVAVVAGPVVIHTGGGEHLARLVREGYVQALLGGNAIAVHDIEQALLGTSLGVDMQRGVAVRGGHRHHLQAINMIRRCGGIRQAVEQGVLSRGIFYECVRRNVPFSLAGSIRDDGPLPDTQMDLMKAQADYARLLAGSDMTLMLSTMLHSIGAGNMTPSGVKLVCVDINPAVVTKLSDRGSLESVGVVTDVGLFLSLLVRRLDRLTGPYDAGGEDN